MNRLHKEWTGNLSPASLLSQQAVARGQQGAQACTAVSASVARYKHRGARPSPFGLRYQEMYTFEFRVHVRVVQNTAVVRTDVRHSTEISRMPLTHRL